VYYCNVTILERDTDLTTFWHLDMSRPEVLDARPCAQGIALTMYDADTGEGMDPVFLPDDRRHEVVVHLCVDYRAILNPRDCRRMMRSMCDILTLGRVQADGTQLSEVPGCLPREILSCRLCTSETCAKPMVYGTMYGKDHLHAWLAITFLGPESPAVEPVAEVERVRELCNQAASRASEIDKGKYYLNAQSPELVDVSGIGVVSRCRRELIQRVRTEPPTGEEVESPLHYLCFDAEWRESAPHLFAFVLVRDSRPDLEFVVVQLDEDLATHQGWVTVDAGTYVPEIHAICWPSRAYVRPDGVVVCMWPAPLVAVAAVSIICNLAPVVVGYGILAGDFHALSKYVPGVFTKTGYTSAHWGTVNYSVNSGRYPVCVDYLGAFTKDSPIGPTLGLASGMPLRECPYASGTHTLDLKCLLHHTFGPEVSDLKRKFNRMEIEAGGPAAEMDYCMVDARVVVSLSRADSRHLRVRSLCAMAGAPWGWITLPSTLRPPGVRVVTVAAVVAAIARCGILPRRFKGTDARGIPGGINVGVPTGIFDFAGKFDISGAYREAVQAVDLPMLLIGWTRDQLQTVETRLHQVPARGDCKDFANLYVAPDDRVSPLAFIMRNKLNSKILVNCLVGNLTSGCMGRDMQLVAYATMAIVHEACSRMRAVAVSGLSPCQVCGDMHVPGQTACDMYEAPSTEMLVPAITDEVVLLHLTPGAESYAHATLQRELQASPLTSRLVLKPPETGTLLVWSGSSSFLMPTGGAPHECKGKGHLLNSTKEHAAARRIKMAMFYLVTVLMLEGVGSSRYSQGHSHWTKAITEAHGHEEALETKYWPDVRAAFVLVGIDDRYIQTIAQCVKDAGPLVSQLRDRRSKVMTG
jgi:hypothetical protein